MPRAESHPPLAHCALKPLTFFAKVHINTSEADLSRPKLWIEADVKKAIVLTCIDSYRQQEIIAVRITRPQYLAIHSLQDHLTRFPLRERYRRFRPDVAG